MQLITIIYTKRGRKFVFVVKNNKQKEHYISKKSIFAPINFLIFIKKTFIMKKIFFLAIAALAMTFASCGNKAKAPEAEVADTVAVIDAAAEAEATINALAENLESKDVNAFQSALESIKAKVAEFLANNPAIAQEYLAKVQGFLKENADKIKAFVGTNAAVSSLIDGISAIPSETVEKLTGATEALKALGIDAASFAGNAVEGAKDAVEGAKDAVEGAVENAKDAAANAVENAKDAAVDKANAAVEDAKAKTGAAIDKAASDAKKKLGL